MSSKLVFAALGLACVAAAAGGGYLAGRQTTAPVAAVAAEPEPAAAAPVPATVQETEATVPDARASVPPPSPSSQRAAASGSGRAAVAEPKPAPARPRPSPPAQIASAPALDRTWPAAAQPGAALQTPEPLPLPAPPVEERPVEAARAPEPPQPTFDEVTVSADSVIGLQTEIALSSENARVEDRVEARVVRDVRAGGRVAIPAGTRALGSVTVVERGGRLRERARLGIRFHTLAFADGTRLPITTETIYRYGDERSNGSAAKIGGGAVAGAILGAIIGGGRGAAIGATTGAAGGTAAVMASGRSEATLPAGVEVTARILSPVNVTVER